MSKKVTIQDLALALNLTPATVSRALNDSYQISQKTKERVWRLANELNYVPDRNASSLRSNKTKLVGIIVPDISYYFYSQAISGVEEILISNGYRAIICQTGEKLRREQDNLKDLAAIKVDGIIASLSAETQTIRHFNELLPEETPIIFIDRVPSENNYVKIVIDNSRAAYSGVNFLIKKGRRKIIWMAGPKGLNIAQKRYEGYCWAHQEAGLSIDHELVVHCNYDSHSGVNEVHRVLAKRPDVDAIFAINDRLAIEALAAVRLSGKRVGNEILVLGFNNEAFSPWLYPSLSSIFQPAHNMGKEAAIQLIKLMARKKIDIKEYIFETLIVERDSTGKSE